MTPIAPVSLDASMFCMILHAPAKGGNMHIDLIWPFQIRPNTRFAQSYIPRRDRCTVHEINPDWEDDLFERLNW
jgi:hypothetical protein